MNYIAVNYMTCYDKQKLRKYEMLCPAILNETQSREVLKQNTNRYEFRLYAIHFVFISQFYTLNILYIYLIYHNFNSFFDYYLHRIKSQN